MDSIGVSGETMRTIRRLGALYGVSNDALVKYLVRCLSAEGGDDGNVVVVIWRTSESGGRTPRLSRREHALRAARAEVAVDASAVGTINLDEPTHALVRFAARVFDVSESEVVTRAVKAFSERAVEDARPARDPWDLVEVYGEYDGQRVDGKYLPATRRLTVTSGPVAGQTFKSPSGASRAVVAALNPDRAATQTNGWRFWRIVSTDERLQVLR